MTIDLPQPIASYFLADRGSSEAIAACFTPDAVVRDEGHTYQGRSEIQSWKTEATAKYVYNCEPLSIEQNAEASVVTCRLEGNFPGSPADLRFVFHLAGDKIASLEIAP